MECQDEIKERKLNMVHIGKRFFCVDLETSGLDPYNGAEIIEIYYKIVDENGLIEKEFHSLYDSPFSDNTFEFHKITKEELRKYKPFIESDNRHLIDLINECKNPNSDLTFMAHYSYFEISFFEKYLNVKFCENTRIYDTREAGVLINKEEKHNSGSLAEKYHIICDGEWHRSKHDVNVMFEIAKNQFKEIRRK